MVALQEIAAYLDRLLGAKAYSERFPESNGLKITVNDEVKKVGVAVCLSNEVIGKAVAAGVDLLLTHHASWERIEFSLKFKKHLELEKNAINLYVAHECLDAHSEPSPSVLLAKQLGVEVEGTLADDYGVYGNCGKSFGQLKEGLGKLQGAKLETWNNSEDIGKVAVVAGGGGRDTSWLNEAFRLGCKTYVTGEALMFTKLFAKESGMNLLLAGHLATERLSMERLVKILEQELKVKAKFIEEEAVG